MPLKGLVDTLTGAAVDPDGRYATSISTPRVLALGDVASGTIALDLTQPNDLWTARLTGASVNVAITRPSTGTRIGVLHLTRDGTARTAALSVEPGVVVRWLGAAPVALSPEAAETMAIVITATAGADHLLCHLIRYSPP